MDKFPEYLVATKAIRYNVAAIVEYLKEDAEGDVTMEDVLLYVEQLIADDFKFDAQYDDVILTDSDGEEY